MDLCSYSLEELKRVVLGKGERAFRADQIFHFLYKKKVFHFEDMKNLPKNLKIFLKNFFKFSLKLKRVVASKDGESFKFLWELEDGNFVESVLIVCRGRNTVCVSSQVGCMRGCAFCASGRNGFFRNLKVSEMVEQVLNIEKKLNESGEKVSNVVFMGMGEPLDNCENVIKVIGILGEEKGLNMSNRRITISTVGVIEGIERLMEEGLKVNLALSLHSPNQRIREKIVKSAGVYEFEELLRAVRGYFERTKRDVSYEYILIDGVNDSDGDAMELADVLEGRHFVVNLIPFNEVKGSGFRRSKNVRNFKRILESRGICVTQRYEKGGDIEAACGQLAFLGE
jgi:23S rRNA (adenine2503-C2)-methyltransferase